MPQLTRRFSGQPYSLFARVANYDKTGRSRSPALTKAVAENNATRLRARGYNARVVSWVGGSGIYARPSLPRRYNRLPSDDQYFNPHQQSSNRSGESGITSDETMMFEGDNLPSGIHCLDHTEEVEQTTKKWLDNRTKENHENMLNAMKLGERHTFEGSRRSLAEQTPRPDSIAVNMRGISSPVVAGSRKEISPGWGGELGSSKGTMPDISKTKEQRYWVGLSWPEISKVASSGLTMTWEDAGYQPLYAFATVKAAEEFRQGLNEQIKNVGQSIK